jgi:hypothetical protein
LDELPNASCYWALPGELLSVAGNLRPQCGLATYGFAGIAAINDVLPAPLSIFRLPFSVVTPLSLIADLAIGSRDTFDLFTLLLFSCRDDALHWVWLPVLSTPWLIPTLL